MNELYHYNKNHDRLGRFARRNGPAPAKSSNIPEKKSNHRINLENKYIQKGMSRQEAEQAANDRIRTEKILAVIGITAAATAATAYGVHKYKEYTNDTLLKSDDVIQRVVAQGHGDVSKYTQRDWYGTIDKKDFNKYKGLYGNQLLNAYRGTNKVDVMQIRPGVDMKIASEKSARDTFESMFRNDMNFRRDVYLGLDNGKRAMGGDIGMKATNQKLATLYDNVLRRNHGVFDNADNASRKQINKIYDAFNINYGATKDNASIDAWNKFKSVMKNQGYDAIKDINDSKYSGYGSKGAMIFFDKANLNKDKNLGVQDFLKTGVAKPWFSAHTEQIGVSEVQKLFKKEQGKVIAKQIVNSPTIKMYGAVGAGLVGGTAAYNQHLISVYRDEHPNSTMTNKQILDMLEKEYY